MSANNETLVVCWGVGKSGGTSSDWIELDGVDRETMFSVTLQPVTTTMQDNQIRVFLSIPQVWVNVMDSRGLIGLFITTGLVESIFDDNRDCTPQNIRSI